MPNFVFMLIFSKNTCYTYIVLLYVFHILRLGELL